MLAVFLLGCGDPDIPFRSEIETRVSFLVLEPTPMHQDVEEVDEEPMVALPSAVSTQTPKPKSKSSKKSNSRKSSEPSAEELETPKSVEDMRMEIEIALGELQKLSVSRDDAEGQIPEMALFDRKVEVGNIDEARNIFINVRKKLKDFKIDSNFISRKVERTILVLNRAKINSDKYASFQSRIEKLEKPINERRYKFVNKQLTTLQDDIMSASKLDSIPK